MEQRLLSKEDIVNQISEIYDEECEKRVTTSQLHTERLAKREEKKVQDIKDGKRLSKDDGRVISVMLYASLEKGINGLTFLESLAHFISCLFPFDICKSEIYNYNNLVKNVAESIYNYKDDVSICIEQLSLLLPFSGPIPNPNSDEYIYSSEDNFLFELDLGAMKSDEFKKIIDEFLQSDNKRCICNKIYTFFNKLSYESEDVYPMAEDISKAREIKYRLAKLLSKISENISSFDIDKIFKHMCYTVLNYNVVDKKVLKKYTFLEDLKEEFAS